MAVRVTRAGVGLTVGIIVLALVIVGGLYLVKERGEQARREDAIEVAQQNLEEQSEPGAITPAPEGDAPQSEGASSDDTDTTEDEGAAPSALPATGAGEGIITALAAGIVTYVAVSYVVSRKNAEA